MARRVPALHRLQKMERPDDRWERLLDEVIELVDDQAGDRPLPAADEVIHTMREERDAQLLDHPP